MCDSLFSSNNFKLEKKYKKVTIILHNDYRILWVDVFFSVACPPPPSIADGYYDLSNDTVQYFCNEGFSANQTKSIFNCNNTIWENITFSCEGNVCLSFFYYWLLLLDLDCSWLNYSLFTFITSIKFGEEHKLIQLPFHNKNARYNTNID